ncbi:Uracil-DNA glycosylase [Nosema granulosis]|uniref:Uracil-DNA glycosylase n=1 Tax=Nosema granulosis TaxID=83296 RepID=A0A9P6H187_9MICR|nr:Uracil-DNA glycosylase [Nosema granulosis]
MKKDILYFLKKKSKNKENIAENTISSKIEEKCKETENISENINTKKIEKSLNCENRENIEENIVLIKTEKDICKENKLNTCSICNLVRTMLFKWDEELNEEFSKQYFKEIISFLHNIPFFPTATNIFRFTFYFPIEHTKVVILGQDPYHNENQAMGLSFSVPRGIKIPPSLRNIYKELKEDIKGFKIPEHGDLTNWAEQGVLMLNDILTVEKNKPGSHSKIGWKIFTKKVLEKINERCSNVVFIFWGNYARSKADLIDKSKHLVLESAHPSPFSARKFFNCKHFSKANEYLILHKKEPIDWIL